MPYPATPKTWVAGDVLTAAQMNAELRDALLGAFPLGPPDAAWPAWAPTWAGLTVGNGTVTARYTRTGRTIHYYLKVVFGSTSAVTGAVSFTLPVAPSAGRTASIDIPSKVQILDTGFGSFTGGTVWTAGSTVFIQVNGGAGTYAQLLNLSATIPMTWATGDAIVVDGTYEAAT
jgi:hypothetical protein